jgi:hypothetical protein
MANDMLYVGNETSDSLYVRILSEVIVVQCVIVVENIIPDDKVLPEDISEY